MKNKLVFLFLVIILLGSIFINFKVNHSYIYQTVLLDEFNNSQLNATIDFIEKIDHDFPNTSATTLPMSLLKARYYFKNLKPIKGLNLLHRSLKSNPYLGVSEFELSKYYYNRNIDSAYYYSKSATNKLPRNTFHTKIYFSILSKLKKEEELDSAFNEVKNHYYPEQWKDYIFSKLEFPNIDKQNLENLVDEGKNIFSQQVYLTLSSLVRIGLDGLSEGQALILKAERLFDESRLLESAIIYDAISKKDPTVYTHIENAGIAYFKSGVNEPAEKAFRYVIENFPNRNGKSEFYLGLIYLENKDKERGCFYLRLANKNFFPSSGKVLEKFCN